MEILEFSEVAQENLNQLKLQIFYLLFAQNCQITEYKTLMKLHSESNK